MEATLQEFIRPSLNCHFGGRKSLHALGITLADRFTSVIIDDHVVPWEEGDRRNVVRILRNTTVSGEGGGGELGLCILLKLIQLARDRFRS
eukprot:NODE_2946_length_442_cov_99.162850_g2338_i0.p1 GENE.NODE_2946_length_442_cov_99.162850_g2338_i0~~NODE_2946_length_442_cov_99.162850_g2338_i0.p1  ORF type:complete len:91 (-),score=13.21 NODE_2946_length_442_cov_99.162850_g2338_i0:74-346(-)